MELRRVGEALLRRWWLIVGLPLVVLIGAGLQSMGHPYETMLRATVLIPGDTETPGNAERPELMVLDDVPAFVGSQAFADAVAARLPTLDPPARLDARAVHGSLTAERYSRVVTIRVRRANAGEARAIGSAAAAALPDAVNQYLVAAGGAPATVRIIDPPGDPVRAGSKLIVALETMVALAAGVGLAALAAALDDRLYSAAEVEEALGLPVLADGRARRRGPLRLVPAVWGARRG